MATLDRLDSRVIACVRSFLIDSMLDVAIHDPDDVHAWFGRAWSAAQWRVASRFVVHTVEWHANLNQLYHEHVAIYHAHLRDLHAPDLDSDGNLRESYGLSDCE